MIRRLLLTVLFAFVLPAAANAGYVEGLTAANNGDLATARREWLIAANEGDAQAQYGLGTLYEFDLGVPLDYVQAYEWFDLASGASDYQISSSAAEARDKLATQMTPDQIATAQHLASQVQANIESSGNVVRRTDDPATAAIDVLRSKLLGPGPSKTEVPVDEDGGTFLVPVVIDGVITLKFTVDSGAADVSIPADVVSTLMRMGELKSDDFIGTQTFTLADGSAAPSQTFRIRSLQVGDKVLENVIGSIAPAQGVLLLGQSFLANFQSWSIDNSRQMLVLQSSN
jgi:aspartyl protease family protein